MTARLAAALATALLPLLAWAGEADPDAAGVYAAHCASCHGAKRYGGYAPPLIPDTLKRRSDERLQQTILEGLPATQMPAFAHMLDEAGARSLVAWLRRPVGAIRWDVADVAASRVVFEPPERRPPLALEREELILVVERGTGSISVLDGRTFDEVDRFPVGRVHGGPKFDLDLRRVWAATRDGALVVYDLERPGLLAKAVVAVNTRNLAVSPDGALVAVANLLPPGVLLLDADLNPLERLALDGQPTGIYALPGSDRFVLSLRDRPALIEIPYASPELLETALPEPFEDFAFVPGRSQLLASSRGGERILLWDLAARRAVATLDTEALPHLFSACFFRRDGRLHAALNHVGVPRLSILDLESFTIVREIELVGSGFFVRTHAGTPWLWADTNTEAVQLIDKATLALREKPLVPGPGKKSLHVEFSADGARALVSVWDADGAVVVYDSRSLAELRRLPYAMPVGKYNAANKTRLLR
jgi:mono/diheme cytochrome c family protein